MSDENLRIANEILLSHEANNSESSVWWFTKARKIAEALDAKDANIAALQEIITAMQLTKEPPKGER